MLCPGHNKDAYCPHPPRHKDAYCRQGNNKEAYCTRQRAVRNLVAAVRGVGVATTYATPTSATPTPTSGDGCGERDGATDARAIRCMNGCGERDGATDARAIRCMNGPAGPVGASDRRAVRILVGAGRCYRGLTRSVAIARASDRRPRNVRRPSTTCDANGRALQHLIVSSMWRRSGAENAADGAVVHLISFRPHSGDDQVRDTRCAGAAEATGPASFAYLLSQIRPR